MEGPIIKLKSFLPSFDSKNAIIGLISVGLRAVTLGSKFLLIIYLAKCLSPEKIGTYGLFTASVNYSIYILGLDYYTYANRETLSRQKEDWTVIIRDQAIFYFIAYVFALPILCLIFLINVLSWKYIGWFYLILTLEHLAQESYRLLVVLKQPLKAGLVLFVRTGLWAYAIIFIMMRNPEARVLTTVWGGWALGAFLCLIVSSFIFYRLDWASVKTVPPDWTWIRKGVKIAFPFFISTLALRGIYTFDRYFLKYYWGESTVGVYTFYFGIANVIQYFIDAAIVVIYYPKIVSSYRLGNIKNYLIYLRQMTFTIFFSVVIISGCLSLCIWPFLNYIGKTAYSENITVFWILLVVNVVITVGYIPHYALYAIGRDKDIVIGTIFAFFICMLLYSALCPHWGAIGVGIAMLITSSFIGLYKYQKYHLFLKTCSNKP
jgi:O-antigen/teichoic acid export membrane protein